MESKEPTPVKEVQTSSALKPEPAGMLDKVPSKPSLLDQPWQEWLQEISKILADVPELVGKFFSDYRQPLITVLLIIAGGSTVYVTLAVLDAIEDIPLLGPIMELVGLGYTAWFVWRYLLKSSTRQELVKEFDALKTQVIGEQDQ